LIVEEKERDDILLDLFIHPGWKMLIGEAREALDALVGTAHTLSSERELWKRKGEIQQLSAFLATETVVRAQIGETDDLE
jgi:hypothetical protein